MLTRAAVETDKSFPVAALRTVTRIAVGSWAASIQVDFHTRSVPAHDHEADGGRARPRRDRAREVGEDKTFGAVGDVREREYAARDHPIGGGACHVIVRCCGTRAVAGTAACRVVPERRFRP